MLLECSRENQKLSDKAVEHRQSRGCEASKKDKAPRARHGRRQAAEFLDQVRVPAVIEHSDAEEQRAGGDSVTQHLEHRALNRNRVKRKNSQHDEIPGG